MRTLIAISVLLMSLTTIAQAQSPVVVELFTSQGCNSCPPADAFLEELADRDDVLPLAFHVDYWDYLGWKDDFASREFTQRQYDYSKRWGKRSVYTPQMVVAGESDIPGFEKDNVVGAIADFLNGAPMLRISHEPAGKQIEITVTPLNEDLPKAHVLLVRYAPSSDVEIKAGENRGKTITYVNIVREITVLGEIKGMRAQSYRTRLTGDGSFAVLVQARDNGPMIGAMVLE
ncbi:MAG TPA: DUF1223 domain-containing protein [Paracoccaceae bacterium]|nr:DUF1223 domain-containing protein [Paracoccaceae bacterium]